jgi:hypothetical protein
MKATLSKSQLPPKKAPAVKEAPKEWKAEDYVGPHASI